MGLFHFDIKLENIMIDEELELANADSWVKVVDFGCVKSILEQHNGFKRYNQGTYCYNAPEIHNQTPYMGAPVDVFALGYVLFAMAVGKAPFEIAATLQDDYYKLLAKGKIAKYWGIYDPKNTLSEELKHLVTRMFSYNPWERLTLDEVRNHPWMAGPMATSVEVQTKLFEKRQNSD